MADTRTPTATVHFVDADGGTFRRLNSDNAATVTGLQIVVADAATINIGLTDLPIEMDVCAKLEGYVSRLRGGWGNAKAAACVAAIQETVAGWQGAIWNSKAGGALSLAELYASALEYYAEQGRELTDAQKDKVREGLLSEDARETFAALAPIKAISTRKAAERAAARAAIAASVNVDADASTLDNLI